MTVTRVPLYVTILQLSMPRAVVSWIIFCVNSRYSIYEYLYYITVGKPAFNEYYICLIFIDRFLFEKDTGSPSYLDRCYSPVKSRTRLCSITD